MIGNASALNAAARCRAKTKAGMDCRAPAMRNGCCHKHGGKVRQNLYNRNAVTHGRRRRRVVAEKRLMREMLAQGREMLRAIKAAHRAEMAAAKPPFFRS